MSASRPWFAVRAEAASPAVAEIEIYDFIGDWIDGYWGFGVTAKMFLDQLAKLPDAVKTVKLRVNSPGGCVYSATAIANLLRDQQTSRGRTVEVVIDGIAASAATIITSAGSKGKIAIADNALFFIHNPLALLVGTATDFRRAADDLDKLRDGIVTAYRWRSPLRESELRALMDAETLMTADEAIARSFADFKVGGLPAQNAAFDARGVAASVPRLRAALMSRTAPGAGPLSPANIYADRAARAPHKGAWR